jgi:hypothetical protein
MIAALAWRCRAHCVDSRSGISVDFPSEHHVDVRVEGEGPPFEGLIVMHLQASSAIMTRLPERKTSAR